MVDIKKCYEFLCGGYYVVYWFVVVCGVVGWWWFDVLCGGMNEVVDGVYV